MLLNYSYNAIIILQLITVAAIKLCSETPFNKNSYHSEIGQLICKVINLLVSTCYKFLSEGISEQTIVQVFSKNMVIFKKQSNIDSLKISFQLTLPSRLNSPK